MASYRFKRDYVLLVDDKAFWQAEYSYHRDLREHHSIKGLENEQLFFLSDTVVGAMDIVKKNAGQYRLPFQVYIDTQLVDR